MKWGRTLVLGAALILALPEVLNAQVKSSALSRDSIMIGDQVIWKSVIDLPECDSIVVEPYSRILAEDTAANKVEVVAEFALDTARLRKLAGEIEARVILTSFDSGSYVLPKPQIAYFKDGDIHYIDFGSTPKIDVNTIQIDTTAFEARPIKGQIRYPVTFKELLPWIIGALLFAALVWLGIKLVRKILRKRAEAMVQDPPHVIALRELENIRQKNLWQSGKEKEFYTNVTETLRKYIEKMYGVSALEKTTSEIFQELQQTDIQQARFDELHELFQMADLVKFAKMSPEKEENENAIPVSVRFVNDTYEQYLAKQAAAEAAKRAKAQAESAEVKDAEDSGNNHRGGEKE